VPPYRRRFWAYSYDNMVEYLRAGRLRYTSTGVPCYKRYLDEMPGVSLQDLWDDIPPVLGNERLGYPTQKPRALLERIIQASSNPGDVVLDPFCGCGTAICASQLLGRDWIGTDITHLAIAPMRQRLDDMFGEGVAYEVVGQPADVHSARALAEEDRYQFEWWALSLLKARPGDKRKKGAHQGMHRICFLTDEARVRAKRAVVQVKSGHVHPNHVRDLPGVVQREKAALGFLVTLEPPTRPMLTEALAAGAYHSPGWNRDYPLLQIRTVEQLLAGEAFDMPPANITLAQAQRVRVGGEQEKLW
jgi:site-specific DNA-methyltransferase (adenine-specific)